MPGPATDRAMAAALAWASAVGRAERIARAATGDDARRWAERNLIQLLALWAWSTRTRRDLIPFYRQRSRLAIAAYRELWRDRIEREEMAA
jgi:hypothetical protein